VFAQSRWVWPSSEAYRSAIYPALRDLLTSRDLFSFAALGWLGTIQHAHRVLSNRASLLARLLESQWGITATLAELPAHPYWVINTTCVETGKNWRFSRSEMGDWQFGRHYTPAYKVAAAAAASAAVPYAIGALAFDLPLEGWHRTDPATREPLAKVTPPMPRVRLWDGGAYENLGLECLYKPGEPLRGCDLLICSDASGPLRPPPGLLQRLRPNGLSSPRLFDIASDQIRALRSRMLVRDLEAKTVRGALVKMGNSVRDIDIQVKRGRDDYDLYLSDEESRLALTHPTDLKAPSKTLFDRIARHGFEAADATLSARLPGEFPHSYAWAA
jgi:NTE family protein